MQATGSHLRRIEYLERQVQQLAQQLARMESFARVRSPRRVSLAKTVTSGTYPTSGNCFEIVFLDVSFTESAGTVTPTWTELSGSPMGYAYAGRHLDEDTICVVAEKNNRWVVVDVVGSSGEETVLIEFQLTSAMATTDSEVTANAISTPVGDSVSGTVTLVNPAVLTGSTYRFSGATNARGHAIKQNNGKYLILQMDCP